MAAAAGIGFIGRPNWRALLLSVGLCGSFLRQKTFVLEFLPEAFGNGNIHQRDIRRHLGFVLCARNYTSHSRVAEGVLECRSDERYAPALTDAFDAARSLSHSCVGGLVIICARGTIRWLVGSFVRSFVAGDGCYK